MAEIVIATRQAISLNGFSAINNKAISERQVQDGENIKQRWIPSVRADGYC